MPWAYLDGGAEDHVTLDANRAAFARWSLRSRVLSGAEGGDLATRVGGEALALPILLAPTGLTGLAHPQGEVGAARAAERAGTRAIVSTAASYSLEEVAAATAAAHMFQLYPWVDEAAGARDLTESLIARAKRAGYAALVVTVDAPTMGNRERERRAGMGIPPVLTPRRVIETALHPRWAWGMATRRRVSARNLVAEAGARAGVASAEAQYRFMRPDLVWDDLAWMRERWSGPFLVKGILDPDDAERAVELGATGVVVSNHGGRQLDGAVASLDALAAVADRIGDRAEVLMDGGIRRGSDVVKALCLGATAVCIGRPFLYGLAVGGGAGVERVLAILREELARTMTLMGVASVRDLDRSWLVPAP
jgi:L-lactate dehydrogenase (cytochrome)/(S)-mandelate dehydrogenase